MPSVGEIFLFVLSAPPTILGKAYHCCLGTICHNSCSQRVDRVVQTTNAHSELSRTELNGEMNGSKRYETLPTTAAPMCADVYRHCTTPAGADVVAFFDQEGRWAVRWPPPPPHGSRSVWRSISSPENRVIAFVVAGSSSKVGCNRLDHHQAALLGAHPPALRPLPPWRRESKAAARTARKQTEQGDWRWLVC
ncbi:hypothetical protein ZHAS_00022114 [Anopheles sinensis]|uniref:Uncharacterized protein n=1 Tax=Anopheles sinensis TaxID=74873 RepID=A0A084WU41_ANOSI|nr:hypothetical protein ZHAS_00022114 [Anopheles sinensis]